MARFSRIDMHEKENKLISEIEKIIAPIPLSSDQRLEIFKLLIADKKVDWVDDEQFCSEHECEKHLTDYPDGSRYECYVCQDEYGRALGLI